MSNTIPYKTSCKWQCDNDVVFYTQTRKWALKIPKSEETVTSTEVCIVQLEHLGKWCLLVHDGERKKFYSKQEWDSHKDAMAYVEEQEVLSIAKEKGKKI
jgi:hypothetical protein